MSVRKPLEAIFSHLFDPPAEAVVDAPVADEPPAEEPPPEQATPAEGDGEGEEEAPAPEPEPEPEPDKYEVRIGGITSGLEEVLKGTKAAAEHLTTARQLALKHDLAEVAALDQLHGREHRKTGLPPADPLLALEPSLLDSHGLLRARDLLKEVQAAAARRSAQAVGGVDILAEEASSRPPPHFMLSTKTFDAKLDTKQALTNTVRSLKKMRDANRAKELNDKYKPMIEAAGKMPPGLTMEQQQADIKILKRMQGPLAFTRNPRYVLPPRKAASEAAPVPSAVARRDTFIHVIPEKVNFVDYEAGGAPPPPGIPA